ncbi:hypothetical protein BH11PSE12_BH11PSE12_00380 [soil metagenome]
MLQQKLISTQNTSVEQRKAQLLLDAALYRVRIVHAKAAVVQSVRIEFLIQSAAQHMLGAVSASLGAKFATIFAPGRTRFQALLPLALASYSYLSRKHLLKPVMGVGVVLTTVAALVMRYKNSGKCAKK